MSNTYTQADILTGYWFYWLLVVFAMSHLFLVADAVVLYLALQQYA